MKMTSSDWAVERCPLSWRDQSVPAACLGIISFTTCIYAVMSLNSLNDIPTYSLCIINLIFPLYSPQILPNPNPMPLPPLHLLLHQPPTNMFHIPSNPPRPNLHTPIPTPHL